MHYYVDKENKYLPYDKKSHTLAVLFILAGFLIFGLCIAAAFYVDRLQIQQLTMHTQTLCEMERPGELTAILTYDKEPVDFLIGSPSGQWYSKETADAFVDENNQLRLTVHDAEVGEWTMQYNQKSNGTLSTDVEMTFPDELYLSDLDLYTEDGGLTVSFTPWFGDGEDTSSSVHMTIVLRSRTGESHTVYDDSITLNIPISIQCDTSAVPSGLSWNLDMELHDPGQPNNEDLQFQYKTSGLKITTKETETP